MFIKKHQLNNIVEIVFSPSTLKKKNTLQVFKGYEEGVVVERNPDPSLYQRG